MKINEQEVINKYLLGKSVLALSYEYNTYTQKIQNILDKNNINKISTAKRKNPNLIENYFEIINDPNKAYWIGWILTDGGVNNKNGLEISLQSCDKYILDMLQNDLGLNDHVYLFNNDYYKFSFYCKKMIDDLTKYNIIPNKSLTLKYPTNIPKEYETHLLRGMFEGDGGLTVSISTRFYKHRNKSYTKPYRELSFTGTYDMCKNFHDKLKEYAVYTPKRIHKNNSVYRVRWSNADEIISIFHALYDNCGTHYLKRKYELFKQIEDRKYHK